MDIPSSAKEAWEQVSVNPLVPFRVSRSIRLLVLGLEDAHDLAVGVPREVAAGASLRNHAGMCALLYGGPDAVDDGVEFGPGHVARLGNGEHLGRHGADALGGLEDGVVDLEALLLALLLVAAALELGGDLVGPALEAGIDGFEVDGRVPAAAAAVATGGAGEGRGLRGCHARVRARLGDGSIARRGRGLQRDVAGGEGVVVRVIAVVGLGKALVACCCWPGHFGVCRGVLSSSRSS